MKIASTIDIAFLNRHCHRDMLSGIESSRARHELTGAFDEARASLRDFKLWSRIRRDLKARVSSKFSHCS